MHFNNSVLLTGYDIIVVYINKHMGNCGKVSVEVLNLH